MILRATDIIISQRLRREREGALSMGLKENISVSAKLVRDLLMMEVEILVRLEIRVSEGEAR